MLITTDKNTKKRLYISLLICIGMIGLGIFYALFLVDYFSVPCLFETVTGLYCPGCGITRAMISILNFKFIEALEYNKLAYLIIIVIGIGFYRMFYSYIFQKDLKPIPKVIIYSLLTIFLAYGILRNIPGINI